MATEVVGTQKMNMNAVASSLKAWTDREGKIRYYVNYIGYIVDEYREATGRTLSSYYDWSEMRASAGRVRTIIEGNVLAKTKVYIDEEGLVHIYGYGAVGQGLAMGIPRLIEQAVNRKYGYCTEEERADRREEVIGKGRTWGDKAKVGDTVEIVDGRKSVGKTFVIAKRTEYRFSQYRDPSVYLWDAEGFKVSADHCRITEVGYSY